MDTIPDSEIINRQNIKIQQLEKQIENLLKVNGLSNNIVNNQEAIQVPIFESKQSYKDINTNLQYICLVCNQLFTSNDIFNHSQQNKDHIDHCIDIDNIKKQILDINANNKNKKNNIFKERIETIWSSLKSLSATYSSFNSKVNEITNHFTMYHNFLMSKEYSLKKPINDVIDTIQKDITHQINEFKSIVSINNTLNNDNSSKENDFSSADTTDQYTISSIIESIQQSESYNNFIEDNKKSLFNNSFNENNNNATFLFYLDNHIRTFKSSLLKPTEINSESNFFNKDCQTINIKQQRNQICNQLQKIVDNSIVLINETLSSLIRNSDLDRIKQYYKRNNISKLEYNHKSKTKQQVEIKETIIEILKSNRIDILEYFIQELHFDIKTQFEPELELCRSIENIDLLAMSTIYSNFDSIQIIESLGISKKIQWNYDICLELSPFSNNIKVLQYFSTKVMGVIDSVSKSNIFVSGNAALLGHKEMVEWISKNTPFFFTYENTNNISIFCMDIAASNGHLETIKWLHENRTEGCTEIAMNNAAKNGHLETIKWFHSNRSEGCTTYAMDSAAFNGHLKTIKWLHHNRTEGCTAYAMDSATKNGHLDIIEWLHHHRSEGCTTKAMDIAADFGHLEIIKWLHENRTEGCSAYAMDSEAKNGHLETIKWLHHNRTEGCTAYAMDIAAEKGDLEIIKWLHENRTEGCTAYAMDSATKNGHLETIKWLHENRTEGCTAYAMDIASDFGHLEIIKWLHENRTEGCTAYAINSAARNGHLETIKWLYHNRSECSIADAIEIAKFTNQLEVLEWLNSKNHTQK